MVDFLEILEKTKTPLTFKTLRKKLNVSLRKVKYFVKLNSDNVRVVNGFECGNGIMKKRFIRLKHKDDKWESWVENILYNSKKLKKYEKAKLKNELDKSTLIDFLMEKNSDETDKYEIMEIRELYSEVDKL